jgi:hypothetical protein
MEVTIHTEFWSGVLNAKYFLENLGVNGKLILKFKLKIK